MSLFMKGRIAVSIFFNLFASTPVKIFSGGVMRLRFRANVWNTLVPGEPYFIQINPREIPHECILLPLNNIVLAEGEHSISADIANISPMPVELKPGALLIEGYRWYQAHS
jgi:hypothetical protein